MVIDLCIQVIPKCLMCLIGDNPEWLGCLLISILHAAYSGWHERWIAPTKPEHHWFKTCLHCNILLNFVDCKCTSLCWHCCLNVRDFNGDTCCWFVINYGLVMLYGIIHCINCLYKGLLPDGCDGAKPLPEQTYVFLALTHRYVKACDSHSKVSYSWKWCKKNSHIFSGLNLSASKTLQYLCCVAWFTGFLAQVSVTSKVGGSVDGSCEDTWRRQLITGRSYYNIVALLVWSRERLSS